MKVSRCCSESFSYFPGFEALPIEIVTKIFIYCSTQTTHRLVCKDWNCFIIELKEQEKSRYLIKMTKDLFHRLDRDDFFHPYMKKIPEFPLKECSDLEQIKTKVESLLAELCIFYRDHAGLKSETGIDYYLKELVDSRSDDGYFLEALATVEFIKNDCIRDCSYKFIAQKLTKADRINEALIILDKIGCKTIKTQGNGLIVQELLLSGKSLLAAEIAKQRILDESLRVQALSLSTFHWSEF